MSTDFHTRVRETIEAAMAMPPPVRAGWVAERCADDAALLREVQSLLPHYAELHGLDTGAITCPPMPMPGTTTFTQMAATGEDGIEWTPPFAIPPYTVVEIIGRGGMGVVYRAVHPTRHTHVAIKVLRHRLRGQRDWRRFKHEEEVLRQLRHPGIARYLHGGIAELVHDGDHRRCTTERPYFVMEYVAGAPLTAYANREQLATLARLALLLEVCDAVEYAHHRGVIHRDIKPDNILVDADGRARVLDFGIALVQSFEPLSAGERGGFAGTLAYCSPEQRRLGADELTPASDVYTLGLVICELLTGALPQRQGNNVRIDLSGVTLAPDASPSLDADFRACLSVVLSVACAAERHRRFATAGALGQQLAQIHAAYAGPSGWRAVVQRLSNLMQGKPAPTSPNRLLATMLRKRISVAVERDGKAG